MDAGQMLLIQALAVLAQALWMSVALYDNLRHARVNADIVEDVLTLRRMQEEYPDVYEIHKHRALVSKSWIAGMFRLILLGESTATILLWSGVIALFISVFGAIDPETARQIALWGAAMFSLVWSGFLIGGNYWCYWLCHESAQSTHFKLMLWGLLVAIFLTQG